MKLFDRYILASITWAFLFSMGLFLALLMAMDLLARVIKLIADFNAPVTTALVIFVYSIPSMLVYAFPMGVLLAILLVFNRMSSESEMVAIRAAGVSFVRIALPTLIFALMVTGLTFWVSDTFAPFAGARAEVLKQRVMNQAKGIEKISFMHAEGGQLQYTITALNLDVKDRSMRGVTVTFYEKNIPALMIYADKAFWNPQEGRWRFVGNAYPVFLRPQRTGVIATPLDGAQIDIESLALRLQESPVDLQATKLSPDDIPAKEMRTQINRWIAQKQETVDLGQWKMSLARRYAMPFYCIVFALIGAPLGLRHHRTSSAMGLGISLIVIFAFYAVSVYMSFFGRNGIIDPNVAAWLPNVIGAVVGIGLIAKANQ